MSILLVWLDGKTRLTPILFLCLITYRMWYRTDRNVRRVEQGKVPEHAL